MVVRANFKFRKFILSCETCKLISTGVKIDIRSRDCQTHAFILPLPPLLCKNNKQPNGLSCQPLGKPKQPLPGQTPGPICGSLAGPDIAEPWAYQLRHITKAPSTELSKENRWLKKSQTSQKQIALALN